MIGELLDNRYRVLRGIGGGGMGEVYLVENVERERREALKILRPHAMAQAQFIARFRREARAMNRLSHPNIVTVYDFGQLPDDRFYLAMEHADGKDISDVLDKRERLPAARVMRVLDQLADAIDHAHERGVIHRDLKPDNMILIQRYGQTDVLKVMDFGIAKIIAADYEETSPTSHGLRCGTPPYMAPEQFGDVADDPRIDIYALGCIGYELLTGFPPFDGTAIELFQQHVSRVPRRPSHAVPIADIPEELEDVIMRCLEKRPGDRYQRGKEIVAALDQVPGHRKSARMQIIETTTRPRDDRDAPAPSGHYDGTATDLDDPRDWMPHHEDIEAAREYYQLVLRQLADTILDLGTSDAALIVSIAEVRELKADVERCVAEEEQLRKQRVEVERRGREREALLRFATSELRFDSVPRKDGSLDVDIEQQVIGLNARIAEAARDTDDALAAITEREIALAASLARKVEALDAACGRLDGIIASLAPKYLGDGLVAQLAGRLRDARVAFMRARRP